MRQQIKFLLSFLFVFLLFLVSSCEKDLYEEGINQKGLKVSHANFNDLLKDQKFSKAYGKVQTQKNNAAKTVMEEQYQFTIADGLANVIESGNNITYTLLINRDVNDPNSFENLIIKLDSLNQTTAYIIKYSSDNAIDVSNFNISDSNITKLITPIIYNPNKINNSSKGTVYDCYDVTYWACDYPGHTTEGVCTHGYWMTETFCFPVDGGGDSSGDGGSSGTPIDTSGGGGTSGSTGSGSVTTPPNNCGNCNTPIETAPVLELEETPSLIKTPAQIEREKDFKAGLSLQQKLWLANHNDIENDIFEYLESQITDPLTEEYSNESVDFINQIIPRLINEPLVFKSIKPFLIEKQINDTNLDPCSKAVFQQIKNTSNCDFAKVLAKLGADNSVYNTNMVSAVAPSGAPAQTVRNSAYNYTIYISTDYEDKTKLFIAAATLHELVHAYFFSLIDNCYLQNNCQILTTFPELWEYYVSVCDNQYPSNPISHHEEIANSYVEAIASALEEYQPGLSQQVYEDLAWGGLMGTTIFNTLHPEGSSSWQRVKNRIACEQMGHPVGQGTPSEQTNVGLPCN